MKYLDRIILYEADNSLEYTMANNKVLLIEYTVSLYNYNN